MEPDVFISSYERLLVLLKGLKSAADENPELLGLLPLEDFTLLSGLVKELLWNRDV